jgi:hypothetical protein
VIAAFAHHWTVRAEKIVRFVQHTDTAKILEAIRDRIGRRIVSCRSCFLTQNSGGKTKRKMRGYFDQNHFNRVRFAE